MSQPRLRIRLPMNRDSRKNQAGSAMAFLYFSSKLPENPSAGRVEGNGGKEKGWNGELSDVLLVAQPIKKKLKQISAGCWNAPVSLLTPLYP